MFRQMSQTALISKSDQISQNAEASEQVYGSVTVAGTQFE